MERLVVGGFFDLIDQDFDHVWSFIGFFARKKEVLGNLSFEFGDDLFLVKFFFT